MNKPTPILISTLTATALFLSGCGDSAEAREMRKEAGEAMDAAGDLASKTWEEIKGFAEPRMGELQSDFDKLKAEMAQQGEAVKAETRALAANAERQLEALGEKLDRARQASSDSAASAWESVGDALDATGEALKKAWAELKKQ